MSDPRYRHLYDCIAFLDQRWDAMTAEMRAKAVQVEAELHMRIAALTSELAEARRQLGEAVEVQEDLAGKLFGAVQERDALKACRHVGPWIEDRGTWRRVRTIGEAGAVYHAGWITQTMDGKAWNVASDGLVLARRVALDAAKAAADAHLLAAGWWLEGGRTGLGRRSRRHGVHGLRVRALPG